MWKFQSTFPRGERPSRSSMNPNYKYFNPRSRVGNDQVRSGSIQQVAISIHVPAWGTTKPGDKYTADKQISIHVPAWGTTEKRQRLFKGLLFQSTFPRGERHTGIFILNISAYFNPRSRVGNDMSRYLTGGGTVHISIHVPAWGTTIKGPGSIEYGFISIHVPAWGTTIFK